MISKNIHYFFLSVSPWPLLASMLSFNLFVSFIMFLKLSFNFMFISNIFLLIFCSYQWWILYGMEFNFSGFSSMNMESGLKCSMILFISSEVFFFFSFFWSYFHFFLAPAMELGLKWPPIYLEFFDYSSIPLINTLVLLSSGVTVTLAHMYMNLGEKNYTIIFLLMTSILGILFTLLQLKEYYSSFFSINDSSFGTSFFLLTGFHGIHVIIGSLFLITNLMRFMNLSSSKENNISFELASWYWHFVDVIWIFLYFFLYYYNN